VNVFFTFGVCAAHAGAGWIQGFAADSRVSSVGVPKKGSACDENEFVTIGILDRRPPFRTCGARTFPNDKALLAQHCHRCVKIRDFYPYLVGLGWRVVLGEVDADRHSRNGYLEELACFFAHGWKSELVHIELTCRCEILSANGKELQAADGEAGHSGDSRLLICQKTSYGGGPWSDT